MSIKYSHYEKCPNCLNTKTVFIRNGIIYCHNCKKQFINLNGKNIEISLKSANDDYGVVLMDEYSKVDDKKIELSINCSDNEIYKTSFEKLSHEISDEIFYAGYDQNNQVPVYFPMKIFNSVYIFGSCLGIRLSKRSKNDDHIVIHFIVEDDGNWFLLNETPISSAWLEDIEKLIKILKNYLKSQEPAIYNKIQFGWKFKNDKEE